MFFSKIKNLLKQFILYNKIQNLKPSQIFYDKYNNRHYIIRGLKDTLKPNWHCNFNREFTFTIDNNTQIEKYILSSIKKLNILKNMLNNVNYSLHNKHILEFGSYNGVMSMLINKEFKTSNVCTDIMDYYILQRGDKLNNENKKKQNAYLNTLRNAYLKHIKPSNIVFKNDSITNSLLKDSFDFIFSFETIEHVIAPGRMFFEIHRLLKKGGYTYHHYNPFFSLTGGHSFVTTDILYGHVLLEQDDLRKYFSTFRPKEEKLALNFYNNNLNRLTIKELNVYLKKYFSAYSVFYNKNPFLLSLINKFTLKIAKQLYPSLQLNDLLIDEIIIIAKK